MATTYDDTNSFILCSENLKDKIERLETVVSMLIDQSIVGAGNADVSEYMLNDGQIIIKEVYRSPTAIAEAIDRYDKILNRLRARCSGTRIVRRQDSRTYNYLQFRYGN